MEFLNTLVRAFGTYKSPLSFDRVVLVEMFEICVNSYFLNRKKQDTVYSRGYPAMICTLLASQTSLLPKGCRGYIWRTDLSEA